MQRAANEAGGQVSVESIGGGQGALTIDHHPRPDVSLPLVDSSQTLLQQCAAGNRARPHGAGGPLQGFRPVGKEFHRGCSRQRSENRTSFCTSETRFPEASGNRGVA